MELIFFSSSGGGGDALAVALPNLPNVVDPLVKLRLAVVHNKRYDARDEHVTCKRVTAQVISRAKTSSTAVLAAELRYNVCIWRRAPLKQTLRELRALATVVLEGDGGVGVAEGHEVRPNNFEIGANLRLVGVA